MDPLRSHLLQQLIQLIQLYEQETSKTNRLTYVMSLKPGDIVSPADQLSPAGGWELPLQATIALADFGLQKPSVPKAHKDRRMVGVNL